jgi:hypothetical protein
MKNLKELFGFEFEDIQYFTTVRVDRGSKSYLNNRIKLKDSDKPIGRGSVYSEEMRKTLEFWRHKLKIRNLKEEVMETVESFNTLIDDDFFHGEDKLNFNLGVVSGKSSQIAETTKIDDDNSQNLISEIVSEQKLNVVETTIAVATEIVKVKPEKDISANELKAVVESRGFNWKSGDRNIFKKFYQSKKFKDYSYSLNKVRYLKRDYLGDFLNFVSSKS